MPLPRVRSVCGPLAALIAVGALAAACSQPSSHDCDVVRGMQGEVETVRDRFRDAGPAELADALSPGMTPLRRVALQGEDAPREFAAAARQAVDALLALSRGGDVDRAQQEQLLVAAVAEAARTCTP